MCSYTEDSLATLKMSVWQHTEYSYNVANMSVCSHTEDNTNHHKLKTQDIIFKAQDTRVHKTS